MMLNRRNLIHSKRFAALFFAAFVCLLSLTFLFVGCDQNGDDGREDPTGGATEEPKGLSPQAKENIDLKTAEVDLHTIEAVVQVTGSVKAQPKQIVYVTPRIGGIVQRLYFNEGDRVQKREPLLELESLELQAHQIELIKASNQVQRLKNSLDSLKAVSAKKIRLELVDRQISYLESLKDLRRLDTALAKLRTVSVGKITVELERMRVTLVKADVELRLLDASLKRIKSLAEQRISAQKELIEKQAQYAQGKSELDGAKRQFRMFGLTEETVQKMIHSNGDEPVLALLSDGKKPASSHYTEDNQEGLSLLEKYTVLLEGATELVASEAEYQGAVIKVEANKRRALAAGLTEAQIQGLTETDAIISLRDMSIEELLEKHIALLEEPDALVESESEYRGSVIELEQIKRRLKTFGMTPSEINEIIETGEIMTRFTVTASASGQIIEQDVTLGATVQPSDILFQILDTLTVWIEGDVHENAIASIDVGQDVRIRFAAYPDPEEVFHGKVAAISDTMDAEKRAAHLWIEVENPDRKLKPGMFAELAVVIDQKDEVIAVPLAAVLSEGTEKFVIVEEGDSYNRYEIVLGAKDDQYVEVKFGLDFGDTVVVKGNYELMSASGPSKVPLADDGHAHQH